MITIICRWDFVQMDNELEWRMWGQLKGAFSPVPADMDFIFVPVNPNLNNFTFLQFDTIDEALAAAPAAPRVFLEPLGEKTLGEIPQGDIVMILGNTELHNLDKAAQGETYRIQTPGATVLYGINAAAIALAMRHGQ